MIQKIDEVDAAEVGRMYLVPCVFEQPQLYTPLPHAGRSQWLPILGPWHEDKALGFPYWHYHYDLRFLPQRIYEDWATRSERAPFGQAISDWLGPVGEVVWRRRKMLRETPVHPGYGPWLEKLEPALADAELKRVCPHRGFPRSAMARDGEELVCPGHGLRFCARSGRLRPTVVTGAERG